MTMPDLVVCLPDGRTFVRRAPCPQFPPGEQTYETWARFLAAALENMVNAPEGETLQAITLRHAVVDFARDAWLGWQQWLESGLVDGC